MLSVEEISILLQNIYEGRISLFNLPLNLYNDISSDLQRALFQGYGDTINTLTESPALDTLKKLNTNVFEFSAAKEFQQVKDMQTFIFDPDGFQRSFSEFRVDADKVFKQYNEVWLKTEFDTTVTQATSASRWQEIEENKEAFPWLQYQTVGDARVRDDHADLDGITRPVNDTFWDVNMPANGWNCRCEVIEMEQGRKTNLNKRTIAENDPLFQNNPGKQKLIFNKTNHPYFKVPKEYRELKAENFNLPLPQYKR